MNLTIPVGGTPMDAELTLPDGGDALAAVVLCPGLTRDIAGLAFLRDALVADGRAVLAIRYRGMDLLDDDEDVQAAIDQLASHERVDASRIALVGHSRGSMVSLRMAATDARVAAVAAIHPVTDFLGYVRASRDYAPVRYAALVSRFGDADPFADPAPYERYAALNYADRITAPVLLIAGTTDLHSPLHHSQLMNAALIAAGNTATRLEIMEGSGHFFERYYLDDCRNEIAALVTEWLASAVPTAR
ncbi:alpha/beta hydrolase family protein [Glaciibacter superstes]|uniref:alpha/beta hydrolase family protein n=1 Tax=Glaciibacter superstes TaxID=501023 RepID=UPI0003B651BD|nr:alpha/beta fold hydrolase [Glaciibacter superstes]